MKKIFAVMLLLPLISHSSEEVKLQSSITLVCKGTVVWKTENSKGTQNEETDVQITTYVISYFSTSSGSSNYWVIQKDFKTILRDDFYNNSTQDRNSYGKESVTVNENQILYDRYSSHDPSDKISFSGQMRQHISINRLTGEWEEVMRRTSIWKDGRILRREQTIVGTCEKGTQKF